MQTKEELQRRLAALRVEYGRHRSMIEMMEKATMPEDLAKMRSEQLDPINREMQRVEEELGKLS